MAMKKVEKITSEDALHNSAKRVYKKNVLLVLLENFATAWWPGIYHHKAKTFKETIDFIT